MIAAKPTSGADSPSKDLIASVRLWHLLPLLVAIGVVQGLLGTLWLLRFLRDNWHTLGDPLHGVRSEAGREPTPGSQSDGAAG